jgi:hypothetical protein
LTASFHGRLQAQACSKIRLSVLDYYRNAWKCCAAVRDIEARSAADCLLFANSARQKKNPATGINVWRGE